MIEKRGELCSLTIHRASEMIRTRELSPVELTRAFLQRIDALDGRLHSYITVLERNAMMEARAAEAAIFEGGYRGPLHGIPIALKDLFDTAGVRTTANSRLTRDRVPDEDATAVARLRAAGCIVLGKLQMHEWAMGGPDPTSLCPPARNPWDLDCMPGGSSSGSAAAVAAGLCMGSLGSDTGGSIRSPAALCGTVGLKPTYGRVSRAGVLPLSWSQDHCGPITWTVEDAALMLQAIAGRDAKDPTSSSAPVPNYSQALREDCRGFTIGVPRHYISGANGDTNPETAAALERAITVLENLGAQVVEVTVPSLVHARAANTVIMHAEGFAYHEANLKARPEEYGDYVRARLYIGGLLGAADYIQAQRARSLLRRAFAQVMRQVDLIVTPTALAPAGLMDAFDPTGVTRGSSFTAPFNLTGMPAISVNCGISKAGLPIGMQIAGRPFDELAVLRAAYAYQQATRWFERRPPL